MAKKYPLISVFLCLVAIVLLLCYWQYKQRQIVEHDAIRLIERDAGSSEVNLQAAQSTSADLARLDAPLSSEQLADDSIIPEAVEQLAVEEAQPSLRQYQQLTAEKKEQINQLIIEYDQHLSDPEKRRLLQQQINHLMADYNQLTLPLALAKIKQNQ